MLNISKIIAPVDFSDTSEQSLRYAIELAALLQAEIRLVHVYQLPTVSIPEGELIVPDLPGPDIDYAAGIRKRLDGLIQRFSTSAVKLTSEVVEGVSYTEIVRVAEEFEADMIVIGTHGHTGLTHVLLGSVAERVVRLSPIPVLTVRSKKDG